MRSVITCTLVLGILGARLVHSQTVVDVQIDAASNRHTIDAGIYGLAFADPSTIAELRIPLNRSGGNATSRYNWQANATNRAADWFFESIADDGVTAGKSADTFIATSKSAGAEPLITIPMIGWVAKLGPGRGKLASFSVAKYGSQRAADAEWFPDAGNGIAATSGQAIKGNDPNDANIAATATFQQDWVRHLVGRWRTAASGGVRYYALDNEPSLWHVTHRDVHPAGATMDEVKNAFVDYSSRIKAVDGSALIVGPEEWGWSGYFYSGFDQQRGAQTGLRELPDRAAHDSWDYLPWFLDQMHRVERSTGTRLLDVFSVHYYPQGGEFGDDTSVAAQLRRNRSTRSLWDPSYVDESWIAAVVQLVPRLRHWVDTCYPGTRIGITEYSWGAERHINGATAQADILGIFGREGLDMAMRWVAPDASTPTYNAIKMYRNYDGAGSAFGDVSVSSVTPDPDALAVFAAERSTDGALTVMAVNKVLSGATVANIRLGNFAAGRSAQVWQLTSSNRIARVADVAVTTSMLTVTLPAQSLTLFVVPTTSPSIDAATSTVTRTDPPQSVAANRAVATVPQAVLQDPSAIPVTTTANARGIATAPPPMANGVAAGDAVTPPIPDSSICGMQKNDAPLAFCETFDEPFPVTNRSGQLDGTLWGVSRLTSNNNFDGAVSNPWSPSILVGCGGDQPARPDGTDVIVCNGQLRESSDDNHTVTTLALYPKQPFDFANRTGTVAFDVSNDTSGSHGAWPEFWLSDQPVPAPFTHGGPPCDDCSVPRNGFGIRFAGVFEAFQGAQAPNCPTDSHRRWVVDSFVIVRNYVVEERPLCCASGWETLGCVIASSGPNGDLNHIELRISQEQIEVWATDAGKTTLKLMARSRNANLTFTRGLIWLEDSHYNADKSPYPATKNHTFTWDNVAFDGPKPYRDLSFDVLDRPSPVSGGMIILGWLSTPSSPATLKTLPMTAANIAAATSALVMFNFGYDPISTFTYTINGHVHTAASPFPPGSAAWRSVALPVPLTDLVPGTQNVLLAGNQRMLIANVNIVLIAAATVP